MSHTEIRSTLTLADGRELDLRRRGPQGGGVLVYIHGFNTSFDDAARRSVSLFRR